MKKKRIIAVFTAIVMSLFCFASCAIVDESGNSAGDISGEYNGLKWSVDGDGTLVISGNGEIADMDPEADDQAWVAYSDKVNKIVIEEGITYIGSNVFSGLGYVTKVSLPDTVTNIGEYVFSCCDSLESITLPKNVNKIDVTAFSNSGGLKKINVDADNAVYSSKDGIVYSKDEKTLVFYPMARGSDSFSVPEGVTALGKYAFNDADKLEKITLSDTVETIGEGAFSGCIALKEVVLSESLKVIPPYAFSNCLELQSLELPDSVEKIENEAFSYCESLKEITVSKNVAEIGVYAFDYATALEKINVSEDNAYFASVDGVLYNKEKTQLIRVPIAYKADVYSAVNGVTTIGVGAFACCSGVVSVELPQSVKEISEKAFIESNVQNVDLPEGITEIKKMVFAFCADLKTIYIPSSVTKIDDEAFSDVQFETVRFGGTKEQWESCGGSEAVGEGIIKFGEKN